VSYSGDKSTLIKSLYKTEGGSELLRAVKQQNIKHLPHGIPEKLSH
jgi:hypothetical protein